MKIKVLVLCCIITNCYAGDLKEDVENKKEAGQSKRVLTFVAATFDDFVTRTVPEKDQGLFCGYYTELKDKLDKETTEKQKQTRSYLYNRGLTLLEENHHVWSEEIKLFLTDLRFLDETFDKERSDIRSFLYWYGAYQEYAYARGQQMQKIAQVQIEESKKEDGFLSTAKSYVAKATQKVGGWFKGWGKSKTV